MMGDKTLSERANERLLSVLVSVLNFVQTSKSPQSTEPEATDELN
jgi:hypothetical protein